MAIAHPRGQHHAGDESGHHEHEREQKSSQHCDDFYPSTVENARPERATSVAICATIARIYRRIWHHPFKRRDSGKACSSRSGNNLFRILELHHLTPGNKRAHIQVRMRNIRTLMLADEKFRAEEDIERATLDEREMQYLYNDGDHYYFMDTSSYEQIHISAEALGDSVNYLMPDALIRVEFYDVEPVGIELPPTVDLARQGNGSRHQGRDRQRAGQAGDARDRARHPVPSFVNEGDKVRVNTETGEYQSRV